MIWAIGALGIFFLLAYVGKQSRLGRLKKGPWINQFRAVRSLLSMVLVMVSVTFFMRGQIWPGLAAAVVALLLGGSVRYQTHARGPKPAADAGAYTSEEIRAYQTLGLSIGADKKAVKDAWKRLMKDAHPDQGGDVKKASALNAARDTLLKRRR
ncbi:MAG: molecular chaperone DnaJ [Asticcacaulis sp.]